MERGVPHSSRTNRTTSRYTVLIQRYNRIRAADKLPLATASAQTKVEPVYGSTLELDTMSRLKPLTSCPVTPGCGQTDTPSSNYGQVETPDFVPCHTWVWADRYTVVQLWSG
ncbi:hypothetical protein RRG08_014150 [Elysia crispata]|uniref:Uncharacterized protein n=1 Tax=Elysia crispata TaxID=231223 RepID=A0AAE1AH61_9GAST|nr:hypothetical protein RRG08_014150 [Elysia crispata]